SHARTSLRPMAEQALTRAAGAPLIAGNRVRVLRDATENYPAWLAAMEKAERSITIESDLFPDDEVGNRFAGVLGHAARRGVRVRLPQGWLGARAAATRHFWSRW